MQSEKNPAAPPCGFNRRAMRRRASCCFSMEPRLTPGFLFAIACFVSALRIDSRLKNKDPINPS